MKLTLTAAEQRILAHALWRSTGRHPTTAEQAALAAWAEQAPIDWAARAQHLELVRRVMYGGAPVLVTDDGQVMVETIAPQRSVSPGEPVATRRALAGTDGRHPVR